MEWLFKPKVQLGLFVNFIFVMFTLVSSGASGGNAYERRFTYVPPPPPANQPLPYIPLPPPAGPSKATSYLDESTGELNVYLENDMSLIRRPGFLLLLSPICTVQRGADAPRSVLLRFISYSETQDFTYDHSLTITADGVQAWPATSADGGNEFRRGSEDAVPHSVTFGSGGRIAETVGKEIPYEVFARLVSAKRVTFELGPEQIRLTAGQLEALRDMHRRLAQPPRETKRF
jgi:hypothetical protein